MERYSLGKASPFQQLACIWRGGAADSHTGVVEHPTNAGVVLLMPRLCRRRR